MEINETGSRAHIAVRCHEQGPSKTGLQFRWIDDLLRVHASCRNGERSYGRLFPISSIVVWGRFYDAVRNSEFDPLLRAVLSGMSGACFVPAGLRRRGGGGGPAERCRNLSRGCTTTGAADQAHFRDAPAR